MESCIELKISQEDNSFHANPTQKHHRHGFIHNHHHKTHPSKYDSSRWSVDDKAYPGLIGNIKEQNHNPLPFEEDGIQEVPPSNNHSNRRASTTEERRNPFACRKGNTFMWQNVNMTLVSAPYLCC